MAINVENLSIFPIQNFEDESLSMLASTLKIPPFADRTTVNRSQLAVARVYLKIDYTSIFPTSIMLMRENESSFNQKVDNE